MSNANPRIVLVSGGTGLGGSTTFLLNLAGELVRRAVPVLVVTLEHDNPYADDFARAHIPLHVEDERRNIFEDRLSSALRVIRNLEPTAVISCLGPSSFEVLRYLPKGVMRFGMIQSDFPENYPPFEPYLPFLDAMIGVSRQIETHLRNHPVFSGIAVHYLPYGVAMPQEQSLRERRNGEPIRILYLGRLERPQKRVHLFPEILRQLKAANLHFQWTIAGDGPERAWLENEMIRTAPGSKVKFIGSVRYQDVPQLLRAHDISLLVSQAEGLPISLLEAMAYGLVPVVSHLKSGVSEVVDTDCGILVAPDNVDGYAAGILKLAQNRGLFATMSKKASARVREDYSVQAMTDRWLSLLKTPQEPIVWPGEFSISGPLSEQHSLKYKAPGRFLRRLARMFTSRR